MGINTYFQKTAEPRYIAPSMAVGFTINHISAVVIPVFGGMLWMLNWKVPFIIGAVLSLTSLLFVQMIRTGAIEEGKADEKVKEKAGEKLEYEADDKGRKLPHGGIGIQDTGIQDMDTQDINTLTSKI